MKDVPKKAEDGPNFDPSSTEGTANQVIAHEVFWDLRQGVRYCKVLTGSKADPSVRCFAFAILAQEAGPFFPSIEAYSREKARLSRDGACAILKGSPLDPTCAIAEAALARAFDAFMKSRMPGDVRSDSQCCPLPPDARDYFDVPKKEG